MTSRRRQHTARLGLVLALWLLAGSAGPVRAGQTDTMFFSLELACRADRQAGLDLLRNALTALPGDMVAGLRLERLGGSYCVRLGQAEAVTGLEGPLTRVRQRFPEALPVRTRLSPDRLVAKVDLQPTPPPAPVSAADTQASAGSAEVAEAPTPAHAATREALVESARPAPASLVRTHAPAAGLAAPIRLASVEPATPPARVAAATQPAAPKAETAPAKPAAPTKTSAQAKPAASGKTSAQDKPAAPAKAAAPAPQSHVENGFFDRPGPLPFWVRLALAGLVLLAGFGLWRFLRSKKPVPPPVRTETQEDFVVEDPPGLSEKDEEHLQNNLTELALAQGNLLSLSKGRQVKSIYITSCLNGEGKTQAAISLAHGLAINKARVLLVDGNPRAPVLSRRYHSTGVPGLCECLLGDGPPPTDMPRVTKYPNLHLMPFGGEGHGRPDLLQENRLENFLETFAARYDYIIMDGHSLTGSDTNIIACKFDGILMAVQCCRTKWEMVRQASQKMTLMGGSMLGVILNRRQYYIPNFIYKAL